MENYIRERVMEILVRSLRVSMTACFIAPCLMVLCAMGVNVAEAQDQDPTPFPTSTPTATPTQCPDTAVEKDEDNDGYRACGQDFCDRDVQKQDPGQCGCQYQDTSGSCANPQDAGLRICQFTATRTRKKITPTKTLDTMRLGWRVRPSLQGKVEYRCQLFQVTNGKKQVERLIKVDRRTVLSRVIDNGFTEPLGDNSPSPQPTPIPALFEIRMKESSATNSCDSKPISQLITDRRFRGTCRCVRSVPEAGLWCHDLKASVEPNKEYYQLRCLARGKEQGLENLISNPFTSGRIYVGMDKAECKY